MQPSRYLRILKALRASHGISRVGGLNLSAVAAWARLPRSTTYRYLIVMNEQGHVIVEPGEYRGQPANIFFISSEGLALLKDLS